MQRDLFFDESRSAYEQITDLFDFVWPTALAMWNLRWQVQGFLNTVPNPTESEIKGRFNAGSGITAGNLRRATVQQTWKEQTERFARFLLVDVIALYEGWCESVLNSLGDNTKKRTTALQRPTINVKGTLHGVRAVISELTTQESAVLDQCFHAPLLRHRKNSLSAIDDLLVCYKYFKECRNAIMHRGGAADTRTVDAYTEFQKSGPSLQTVLTQVPQHDPVQVGANITLHLRGVVGLSEVILRMIATIDAELSRARKAEAAFVRQWKRANGPKISIHLTSFHNSAHLAKKSIRRMGLPDPLNVGLLDTFLQSNGLLV